MLITKQNVELVKKRWIGRQVDKLTVLEVIPDPTANYIMICKCVCGNICHKKHQGMMAASTRNKGDFSCGCSFYQYEPGNKNYQWKGYGEISAHLWARYKANAKIRNLEFYLTLQDAWEVFIQQSRQCKLSGVELIFGKSHKERSITTASIDRIDSSQPYTRDNIQWIHKQINEMKWDMFTKQFLEYCRLVSYPLVQIKPNDTIRPLIHHKNFHGVGNFSLDHYTRYQTHAKKRHLPHTLGIEELWELYVQQRGYCALTGLPIILGTHLDNITASLDRIDNAQGYIQGNVQWVHKDINWKLRKDLTIDELKSWCKQVNDFQGVLHES